MTTVAPRPGTDAFIPRFQQMLRSGEGLPTLPTVVFQLHKMIEEDAASGRELAAVIDRDPSLTASLLRASNSAAERTGTERVSSLPVAIQRLGMNRVWGICLVASVVRTFSTGKRGLDHGAFWAHSAMVGEAASTLWRRVGVPQEATPDDVYVGGLLHDCGLLLLDQFFPDEYDRAAALRSDPLQPVWPLEETVLGMDHGEVGGLLLGRWSLPPQVCAMVAYHHRVVGAPPQYRHACLVVHAAERICSDGEDLLKAEGASTLGPEVALSALGVPPDAAADLVAEVLERAREARSAFAGIEG